MDPLQSFNFNYKNGESNLCLCMQKAKDYLEYVVATGRRFFTYFNGWMKELKTPANTATQPKHNITLNTQLFPWVRRMNFI